ncbi:MAG TPA: hypothetical protein VE988_06370, partial [Gemmataceae bacterium]|nr:hypothetical protein [Gemmataceae bacterium]
LEVKQRLQAILKTIENGRAAVLPPNELRELRCITVLERMATKDARKLLSELAAGAPDARLTQEASAALKRLTISSGE